jgi:hypothetical protein
VLQFSFQYRPLFSCLFQHNFFADLGTSQFGMIPTAETELLMKRLGLTYKSNNGVSYCLYDPEKIEALVNEIQREGDLMFRFWADVRSDLFINITDMPVDSIGKMYYFSNTVFSPDGENEVWHSGSAAAEEDMFNVYNNLQLPENWIGKDLTLKSSNGTVLNKWKAESRSVNLNLATGKYSVGSDLTGWVNFIHSKEIGIKKPLAYIEISLTRGNTNNYLSALIDGQLKPNKGIIKFESRNTYWRYYIVPKYNIATDRFLIFTNDRKVEFSGPQEVKLPSGEKAFVFLSGISLPLMQKVTHNFQLKNKEGKILVQRLPVAAVDQIVPENQHGVTKNFSDIKVYV